MPFHKFAANSVPFDAHITKCTPFRRMPWASMFTMTVIYSHQFNKKTTLFSQNFFLNKMCTHSAFEPTSTNLQP